MNFENINFSVGLFNLWMPFILVYASIWFTLILIGKRIGRPIEDPEIHTIQSKNTRFVFGFLPTLILFALSFFVPIQSGTSFIVGLIVLLTGFFTNLLCFYSFANNHKPLNTHGIYKYSRNPMYVSGLLIYTGLAIMGWNYTISWYVFILFIVFWVASTHFMVLAEEKFLEQKYGEQYILYKKKVRRYL